MHGQPCLFALGREEGGREGCGPFTDVLIQVRIANTVYYNEVERESKKAGAHTVYH